MAHPLELSYHWQPTVLFATVGAVVCAGAVIRSSAPGRLGVVLAVLALWLGYLGLVWLRTRAYLMVDGSRLTVRRFRRLHAVDGEQLVRVLEFGTPQGPCYRLVVRDPSGAEHRYVAPVALLRAGHSTLFRWILAQAPQAELDRGSARTLDQLRARGLVD